MNLNRHDREKILSRVARLVEQKHFNPGLNGVDWKATYSSRAPRILEIEKAEDFEKAVHDLVSQLKTSHTGFFHQSARSIPARYAINATFQAIEIDQLKRWMFQDVHAGGAAHAAGVEPGDVLLQIQGTEITPPTHPVFKMGETAGLDVLKRDGKQISVMLNIPAPRSKKRPIAQPKAVLFSRVTDGIGVLKVAMFPGAVGIDFAHEIDHAVAELQGCDRLIVDLRGNTGGGIGGLRLMSYLTPEKLPVGYSLTRRRAKNGYRREDLPRFGRIPGRKLALIWLALRYGFVDKSIAVVTEGLGPQRFHGRVAMLVNQHSASAAEMVAGFASENKLARIVGSKTAGRLLSGSAFKVGHGYVLGLPVATYLTWQGTMLEARGITPDEQVELSYEALKEGRDCQLERAIEEVRQL